jgi:predicted nucleic acid-binding protein
VVTTILETTVIVDLLRNYPPAETWIQAQTEASLAITPIIWMEVIGGGPTKVKRIQAASLMQRFNMLELNPADMNWAMHQQMAYELSHGVGMMDCLIASVSYRLQIPLYTHNLKHFTPLLGDLAQKIHWVQIL